MAQFLDSDGLKTLVDNMNKKYQTWIGKDTNLYVRYLGIGELGKIAAIYQDGTTYFETTTIGKNIHLYSSGDVVFNIKDTSTEGFHYWAESGSLNLKGNLVVNDGKCTVWADSGTIDATNINLGGTISVKDPSYSYVDVRTKNPNAYALDNSLDKTNIGASGQFASAFGGNTAALGKRSTTHGTSTVAKGAYSHAEGGNSVTLGADSHAEGIATTAYGAGSHSEGEKTIAKGVRSHAEGVETVAAGDISHTEGAKTETNSLYSHAEGFASKSMNALPSPSSSGSGSSSQEPADTWNDDSNLGAMSHVEGASNIAYGVASHAEGKNNTSYSHRSHVEGNGNTAGKIVDSKVLGESAHAEGGSTTANGDYSHSQGYGTTASGNQSFASGYMTTAEGANSASFGINSKSNGDNSVSFGEGSVADGLSSFAGGGFSTRTTGQYAFAYGYNCHAEAPCAFAIGGASYAKGEYSFALGSNSYALHNSSGVLGIGLTTGKDYQVVVGKNNAVSSDAIFVVGNGASGVSKSNALEVNDDGSVNVNGKLNVNDGLSVYSDTSTLYVQGNKDLLTLSDGPMTLNISAAHSGFAFFCGPSSDVFRISFVDDSSGRSKVIDHISAGSNYTPTSDSDLATKKYVDSVSGGGSATTFYMHNIYLKVSGSNGYEAYIAYPSPNNLVCSSVQELRTLMKITTDSSIIRIPTTICSGMSDPNPVAGYMLLTIFFARFARTAYPATAIGEIDTVTDVVTIM